MCNLHTSPSEDSRESFKALLSPVALLEDQASLPSPSSSHVTKLMALLPCGAGDRLFLRDGIHLLDPRNEHHSHLAEHGVNSRAQGNSGACPLWLAGVKNLRAGFYNRWKMCSALRLCMPARPCCSSLNASGPHMSLCAPSVQLHLIQSPFHT